MYETTMTLILNLYFYTSYMETKHREGWNFKIAEREIEIREGREKGRDEEKLAHTNLRVDRHHVLVIPFFA